MSWIIGILTFILVINCLFLILLILVQLPKKEAGMGTAFGGGATDALFGAGTGNALTNLTKYCTVAFIIITLSLSVMNAHQNKAKNTSLQDNIEKLKDQELNNELNNLTVPAGATNAVAVPTNVAPVPLTTSPIETPEPPKVPETPVTPPEPPPTTPPPAQDQ